MMLIISDLLRTKKEKVINITNPLRAKINSWKTGENIRHTVYGDYYILDEIKSEADLISKKGSNPYTIGLYFEAKNQGLCIFYIAIPPVNVISKIYTIILFPWDTTLRILNKRNLAEILSKDKGLINNFLDIDLVFGADYGKTLSLGRDSDVLYQFKYILKRYTQDLETKIKLEMRYPITFGDIEKTENLELRERILQEFGYENYVREGFKKGKISYLIIEDQIFQYNNPGSSFYRIPGGYFNNQDDKIIFLTEDITFLQVKDSSTGKRYFLKVPPDMRSVQEAKAWTFGLEKEEYDPEIET